MSDLEATGTLVAKGAVYASGGNEEWHYVVFETKPNRYGDTEWFAGRVKCENDFEPLSSRADAYAMAERMAEEDAT